MRRLPNFMTTKCGLRIQTDLPPNFNKILIANRGEIACRIIRTCQAIGVRTVAVYSDADEHSRFVRMADEAYRLGPAPSSESYLNQDAIVRIAHACDAEAIHPGYGFLSENADFVELCDSHALKFIGPSAQSMRDLGLKSTAKHIMESAGVPVTPGYHGMGDQSLATFKSAARDIGYPVMLKAIAGGGGKGIRACAEESELEHAYVQCRNEALACFGNGDLLLEKFVARARHIEFQVFCDEHGHGVHLFERDCSVQRGHQKVLEESPALGLSSQMRAEMGAAAVNAALAVAYSGAGTVEFLVDAASMQYWFMEMNTRLQVEHPVTEQLVGRDVVQWQLHVASGHALPCTQQEELVMNGHALEARIYAEEYNAELQRFTANGGHLHHVRFPATGHNGVRVESGVGEGDEVSTFYDAMIAKVITHVEHCYAEEEPVAAAELADIRRRNLAQMDAALQAFEVAGVATNIEFVKRVVNHAQFGAGAVTTDFIEQHQSDLFVATAANDDDDDHMARVCASLAYLLQQSSSSAAAFRNNGASVAVHLDPGGDNDDDDCVVRVARDGDGFRIESSSQHLQVKEAVWNAPQRRLSFWIRDDRFVECTVCFYGNRVCVFYRGTRFEFVHTRAVELQFAAPQFTKGKGGIIIADAVDEEAPMVSHASPMQAQVADLFVGVGERVHKQQLLANVISMKQYYEIWAQCDGVVADVVVQVAESVAEGQTLIKVQRQQAEQEEKVL